MSSNYGVNHGTRHPSPYARPETDDSGDVSPTYNGDGNGGSFTPEVDAMYAATPSGPPTIPEPGWNTYDNGSLDRFDDSGVSSMGDFDVSTENVQPDVGDPYGPGTGSRPTRPTYGDPYGDDAA